MAACVTPIVKPIAMLSGSASSIVNYPMAAPLPLEDRPRVVDTHSSATAIRAMTISTSTGDGVVKATVTTACHYSTLTNRASVAHRPSTASATHRMPSSAYSHLSAATKITSYRWKDCVWARPTLTVPAKHLSVLTEILQTSAFISWYFATIKAARTSTLLFS